MPGYRPSTSVFAPAALFLSIIATSGCMQEERVVTGSRLLIPPTSTYSVTEVQDDIPEAPTLTQTGISSRISIQPLGTVAYDGFTLPIVHGRTDRAHLAVQAGRPPSEDVLLARNGATSPGASVEIHALGPERETTLVRSHGGGMVLGRSATEEGVLVERPNADGSRWLGVAPWSGGDIRWLKSDGNVNAFGWLHENGTLAYAQRRPDERDFELVIRPGDGEVWRLEEPLPYTWTWPVIAPDGRALYALRLGDGIADLAWGPLEGPDGFRRGLRLHRASDRVDGMRARQILASSTGGAGLGNDTLAWFSWRLLRTVLWAPRRDEIRLLPPGSVAATEAGDDVWMTTLSDQLEQVELLESSTASALLLTGPWIVRPGTGDELFMLLPAGDSMQVASLQVRPLLQDSATVTDQAPPPPREPVAGDPRRD